MPYGAEISRTNPTCFVFLIDRSGSMSEPIGGGGRKKADVVSDAINQLLRTLALRCAKSDGIRDYFHVGVIGYGAQVGFALGGALAGRDLVPISEVANNPLRVESRVKREDDGAGGIFERNVKMPVWFEPMAGGLTPMSDALDLASQTVLDFVQRYPRCYPPIVLNITDGDATDGDPEAPASSVRMLGTSDGEVLLFNLHVSAVAAPALQFPDEASGLPDDFARRLFRMSSELPPPTVATARGMGLPVSPRSRGFVFNADVVSVVQFLEIGTRVDTSLMRG